MRIIYMGTPDYAVPSLKKLIQFHEVLAVFTQPDKPKGRGQKLQYTPVKDVAIKNNIPVFQPQKLRNDEESLELIKKLQPDAIVVVAYGQILPKNILQIPKYGCINGHASILPKLRGAAPINWAIINGEYKTGVTAMLMNEGLDTGDILLKKETEISPDETAESLHDRLMFITADTLIEALDGLGRGEITPVKQNDSESSYAAMMNKQLGHLDFNKDVNDVYNLIRGVTSWPGAYFYLNDNMIKIWKCTKINKNHNENIGQIIDVKKDGIYISCINGYIVVHELQQVGSKRMNVEAYINGHNINKGEILK